MYVCMYKGKQKWQTSVWFAENGNEKQNFVFLGQQTINGNRRLLFQQTCPSMYTSHMYIRMSHTHPPPPYGPAWFGEKIMEKEKKKKAKHY